MTAAILTPILPFKRSSELRLSDVVSALSFALDITEGQPMGHAVNSCLIGMRLAEMIGFHPQDKSDLFYALLLKDSGCSSNASHLCHIIGGDDLRMKHEAKLQDWTRVSLDGLKFLNRNVLPDASPAKRLARMLRLGIDQNKNNAELVNIRCERGAQITRKIGFSEKTSQAIRHLDEHWDGAGYPAHLRGNEIPLEARILSVSQTLEVFAAEYGPDVAIRVLQERSGRWFDPELVRAAQALEHDTKLWENIKDPKARQKVLELEPGTALPADAERIDNLCEAFAEVIDAKSPYTYHHSLGVARCAITLAERLHLPAQNVVLLRRAALLHDIGKLGVSSAILDKPGKLNDAEWKAMKLHPEYTQLILEKITGFEELAYIAGAHHERLDGSGYHRGVKADRLTIEARILAVADVYQALTEDRPYRKGLTHEATMAIVSKDAPEKLDPDCVQALQTGMA